MNYFRYLTVLITLVSISLLASRCGDDSVVAGEFQFKGDLAIPHEQSLEIKVTVNKPDLQKVEIFLADELVQTWKNPESGTLTYQLPTTNYGVGAKALMLVCTQSDGTEVKDERILRILSNLTPELWQLAVEGEYPHDIANFTQGFEFLDGQLIESTGQYGESKVAHIELTSGADKVKQTLDATYFGEGITVMNNTLYQLTWKGGRCFTYDATSLQPLEKDFSYQGEGWGLCNNGKELIMSDGSERIYFRDPNTFTINRVIEVYTHQGAVANLNELEYVDGYIYANIWMTNTIAVIDPDSGKVIAVVECSKLVAPGRGQIGEAFNGIAYNHQEEAFYVTGKRWQKTFKVRFNKKENA